jgi:hypothetical protein
MVGEVLGRRQNGSGGGSGRYRGDVPVADVRRDVESSGISLNELARRLGWRKSSGESGYDVRRVRRTLGLAEQNGGHGYGPCVRQAVRRRTAEAIRSVLYDQREYGDVVHRFRVGAQVALCGFDPGRHESRDFGPGLIDCGMCAQRAVS